MTKNVVSQRLEDGSSVPELRRWIKPGDFVWCGQGAAEPLPLTKALVEQASQLGGVTAVLGMLYANTFALADPSLRLLGYGGIGTARDLVRSGRMDVMPSHYSQLAQLVEQGDLRCDVVLLQLSPRGPDGLHSLGIAHDYLGILARRARVVIAEVNDQMPWTHGSAEALANISLDAVVQTSRALLEVPAPRVGDVERRIAAHVAPFIEDRCVVQPGVGSVADAVLDAVHDRRDLGLHAGLIGDGVRRLMQSGAVSNAFKEVDRGITTTGMAFGSHALYRFIERNAAIALRDPRDTHAQASLRQLSRLIAVNSAVEVDLTGQVNAESADGLYVGAVGGQGDFVRAAQASRQGRSIIALPSSTRDGRGRIVAGLSGGCVTTPRCDADLVVTEWGVAHLRGQPLQERVRRMVAIAAPEHREALARAAHAGCG